MTKQSVRRVSLSINFGILAALRNSIDGLKSLAEERAFVQEAIFGFVLCVALFLSSSAALSKFYVFSAYCFILIIEAVNTAIETVVNRISQERHPLSKKAKDIGSAAVFIAMIHFAVTFIVLIKF